MHELSLTRNIVAICSERALGAQVTRVTLEIGKFAAVIPDSLRFCFDICTQGTLLDGATLEIIVVHVRMGMERMTRPVKFLAATVFP